MAQTAPVIRTLLVHGQALLLQVAPPATVDSGDNRIEFTRLEFIPVETLDAALSSLHAAAFDAILLGLPSPAESGLRALAQLRQASPQSPIILLAAHDDPAAGLQAIEQGAQDYLGTRRLDAHSLTTSILFAIHRHRVCLEMLRDKQAAEAASRAKAEWLAGVSHEIRTPMTAILGFAEHLLDSQLPEHERVAAVQTIHRNTEHLLKIVNDTLDLSKIEAGKLQVEQVRCVPAQIMSEVVSLLQLSAAAKGLALVCRADGPLPQTICTDPTRLRQILINLVGNAVKFTDRGEVRLTARCRSSADRILRMEFDICDTGFGLDSEEVSRLFRPFEQVTSDSRRRREGTGLGLTISQRLASLLGGDITVSSQPGRGSRFRLDIAGGPADGVSLVEFDAAAPTADFQRKEFGAPQRKIAGRLLLAEDGPDSQRLLKHVLSKAGADLTIVENGQLAVEQVLAAVEADEPFDLILMDMQMPVLDGYAATVQLRSLGFHKPILALTAFALSGDREKCLAAGCDDFITKPIDSSRLIRTIGQWLEASAYEVLAARTT